MIIFLFVLLATPVFLTLEIAKVFSGSRKSIIRYLKSFFQITKNSEIFKISSAIALSIVVTSDPPVLELLLRILRE